MQQYILLSGLSLKAPDAFDSLSGGVSMHLHKDWQTGSANLNEWMNQSISLASWCGNSVFVLWTSCSIGFTCLTVELFLLSPWFNIILKSMSSNQGMENPHLTTRKRNQPLGIQVTMPQWLFRETAKVLFYGTHRATNISGWLVGCTSHQCAEGQPAIMLLANEILPWKIQMSCSPIPSTLILHFTFLHLKESSVFSLLLILSLSFLTKHLAHFTGPQSAFPLPETTTMTKNQQYNEKESKWCLTTENVRKTVTIM